MLRFKALNGEESSCSEAEDDPFRNKPTREALEEGAASLYNTGLQLLCESKNEEAAAVFEEILESAYLNDEDDKSPMQSQMRRGCLKNLSTIYANDCSRYESAQRVLLEAVRLDPNNVTLWCRLGRVDINLSDYYEAYYAFQQGLKCSPHHWICVENLVTLAFVLGDYISCLYYCGLGLEKDAYFIRGAVFRDEIFESSPFVAETCKLSLENWDSLYLAVPYDPCWKTKYLKEAQTLIEKRRGIVTLARQKKEEEQSESFICKDRMKSFTLAELCQSIFDFHHKVLHFGIQAFYKPVDMSACVRDTDCGMENNDENSMDAAKRIDGADDTSRQSLNRGRSGVDEKDTGSGEAGFDKNNVVATNGIAELQRCLTDEDCSQSQQSQDTQEPEPKKKSRKDVKWWQYEGKRRSQRVRGHLMPISQTTSKNERGFGETLKNLIHSSLLYGEPERSSQETHKPTTETELECYFGSQPEIDDVKRFICMYGKTRFITVITELAPFLCKLTNHSTWPTKLVNQYLESCKHYRRYRQELNEWMAENDSALNLLRQDALIILSIVEFRLDDASPGTIEALKFDSAFVSDLAYLEIVLSNGLKNDDHLSIRYYWFRVNYELLLAQVGLGLYKLVLHYLTLLEKLLEFDPSFNLKLATKSDNLISQDQVKKKIRFVKKMENISRISELYQNQQYDALIEILQLCLTSEDYSSTDLMNRFYLAESYFALGKYSECIAQCVKVVGPCLKSRNDEILSNCLNLIEKMCIGEKNTLSLVSMKDKRSLTNSMIEILTWNENKGTVCETVLIIPWCILHSVLFHLETQEPVLYLDEETAPNSVVLLQFAHEFLNRSNKCTIFDGKLLTYTVDVLFAIRKTDDHGSYEETKHCIEQAIFCLYSHPSKKSKLKYLTEHCTNGIDLQWSRCIQLYEYYKPEDIPEFDSYQSISAEVEGLFQRILSAMPDDLKPKEQDYEEMKQVLDGSIKEKPNETNVNFPLQLINIYYLLGDHYFKTKDWTKAVEYYTYDLTVIPSRFDSWAAIALSKGEMISSKLNACENYVAEEVLKNSDIVINCFQRALDLEPTNSKIRIEFGSFVYAMHSFCSRLLKGAESLSFDKFDIVETKKDALLKEAINCFEPLAKSYGGVNGNSGDDDEQHELWIHHYLLGKVMEKLDHTNPEMFLNQYELAGKLIAEQGAPYPAKINFYNPPELAVEALEIYYRIHASILTYIEKHEYDEEKESVLSGYIKRAACSPFVKSKQSRGGGGSETSERKRKANEGSKKDQVEIRNLVQDMLKKVEEMMNNESNGSSSSSSDEDDDATSVTSSQASTLYSSEEENTNQPSLPPVVPMSSFGLSAFQEKMREKEIQENRIMKAQTTAAVSKSAEDSSKVSCRPSSATSVKSVPSAEQNKFYKDFTSIKYGLLISQCLSALEECIVRFPQHHKSYFRISYIYAILTKNNWKISKDYLLGSASTDKKRISGLFADRKTNNFFNGVWRNPVDDIDRPGSFPYHMARTIQHLLEVLERLNDHQLLAEVAIALSKVPEQDKQYLYNSERQQFSQQAFSSCVGAAKRYFSLAQDIKDGAISIFETYQKLQKFNAKENVLASVLLDCYKQYLEKFGQSMETTSAITLDHAFKFFQHLTWASKTNPGSAKVIGSKNANLIGSVAPIVANVGSQDLISFMDGKTTNTVSEVTGSLKAENRKKKESLGRQAADKQQVLKSVFSTSSIQASSWPRVDKSIADKDLGLSKKKQIPPNEPNILAGMQATVTPKVLKTHASVFPSNEEKIRSLPPTNFTENKWKSYVQSEYLKQTAGANTSANDPEIIDLSHHRSDNSRLKRRASADTDEVDPVALVPPKKAAIRREGLSWSKTQDEAKLGNSEKGIQIIKPTTVPTKCTPIVTVSTKNTPSGTAPAIGIPTTSTSGGSIPFNLFMECVNKNPKTYDIILDAINKQSLTKRYDFSSQPAPNSSSGKYIPSSHAIQTKISSKQPNSQDSLLIAPSKPVIVRPSNVPTSYSQSLPSPAHLHSTKDFREKVKFQAACSNQPSKMGAPGISKSVPVSVNSFSSRNTSPFKAQTTIVSNPASDKPNQSIGGITAHDNNATPPPAHGRRTRAASEWSSGDEPEIIDLTTPPRKNDSGLKITEITSQPKIVKQSEEMYFVARTTTNYPMPPKKKIQARQRNMSSESSEEPEVIKRNPEPLLSLDHANFYAQVTGPESNSTSDRAQLKQNSKIGIQEL
ncbi:unnamed protein product [Allacma fusca]|uniref:Calcineurin-binding protein cabin-1 n=1 Tax=Allacma fusca TaxID=39272 RepID=A0A8J2JXK4_9HEXA|nr:unnamed protein product [Allacma fusca]